MKYRSYYLVTLLFFLVKSYFIDLEKSVERSNFKLKVLIKTCAKSTG